MDTMPANVAQLIIEWQKKALKHMRLSHEATTKSIKWKHIHEATVFTTCADELAALYEDDFQEVPAPHSRTVAEYLGVGSDGGRPKAATPVSYPENGG